MKDTEFHLYVADDVEFVLDEVTPPGRTRKRYLAQPIADVQALIERRAKELDLDRVRITALLPNGIDDEVVKAVTGLYNRLQAGGLSLSPASHVRLVSPVE